MRVTHIEIQVEEQSMEIVLRQILPKILGGTTFAIYPHQCKQELIKHLPERLRGYARWIPQDWRIVVVVDRDREDCKHLKANLDQTAREAGFNQERLLVINRIAIEELEAWYFGDWEAVRAAYPKVSRTVSRQAKYRDPDAITGGTWESFERILQRSGYFIGGLRKIEAAHNIAPSMRPDRNRSRSFQMLIHALQKMVSP